MEWLLEINPNLNVTTDYNYAFNYSCNNRHLNVAEFIYKTVKNRNLKNNPNLSDNDINQMTNEMLMISSDEDHLFMVAVLNNNYRIAKFLLRIKPDIDITMNNHKLFILACDNDFGRIAFLLTKYNSNYKIIFEYDDIYSESDDETDPEDSYNYFSDFYQRKK